MYDVAFTASVPGNHTVDFYSVDVAGNAEMVDSGVVENAPAEEPDHGEEEEDGGGALALVSGILGLVIDAVVVLVIMMLLVHAQRPNMSSGAEVEAKPEDELPSPPT